MNLPPWLVLSLVITLAMACAYQLIRRRYGWRVLFYWVLILVGFLGAEALVESVGWDITRLGDLRLLPDMAGALLMIGVLWLVRV